MNEQNDVEFPRSQMHSMIKEGMVFEANGFVFCCTGKDDEVVYAREATEKEEMILHMEQHIGDALFYGKQEDVLAEEIYEKFIEPLRKEQLEKVAFAKKIIMGLIGTATEEDAERWIEEHK